MGSITISRDNVDACYVSSETADTALDTYSTFTQAGGHSSSFIADSNPSSGTAQTAVTFVQFTIPEKETTDLSSKAYVSNMVFHINVSNGGDNLHMYKVKSTYENINFANATWHSYDQEGQDASNAKWDPSHFHGSSDTHARSLVAHLATDSTKSPVEGEPISTSGASSGDRTLNFPASKIKKLGYTFGSKVTVGIYADGDNNVVFSMKSTAVTITTASTKPDVVTLTSTPTSDI